MFLLLCSCQYLQCLLLTDIYIGNMRQHLSFNLQLNTYNDHWLKIDCRLKFLFNVKFWHFCVIASFPSILQFSHWDEKIMLNKLMKGTLNPLEIDQLQTKEQKRHSQTLLQLHLISVNIHSRNLLSMYYQHKYYQRLLEL